MNSSRTLRFGAFGASVLAFALVSGGFARAAATATLYATNTTGWHNTANTSSPDASIDVGGTVTWENRDTGNPHPVECVQQDSNGTCPWSVKELDQKPSMLGAQPTRASVTFTKSGTFAFRCAIHTTMTGKVIVGSGKPPVSSSPSSTPRRSASAQPTTRASVTPTKSASVAPAASKSKAAPKPGQTTLASTSAAPSVLAAGPTAAKKNGVSAGAAIPAALLIAFVGGAHIARARRRTA